MNRYVLMAQSPEDGWWFVADTSPEQRTPEGNARYIAMISNAATLTFLDPCPPLDAHNLREITRLLESLDRRNMLDDGSYTRGHWWCEVHNREATHTNNKGFPCCDPRLGGIMLSCACRWVTADNGYPTQAPPSGRTLMDVFFPSQSMGGKLYSYAPAGTCILKNHECLMIACLDCRSILFEASRLELECRPEIMRESARRAIADHFARFPACAPTGGESKPWTNL